MASLVLSPRFDHGVQLVGGREGTRDLRAARAEFAAAAAEGDVRAAHVQASFLAGGIGGPRDWPAAVDLLRRWAATDKLAARQVELIAAMELDPAGAPASVPPARRLHPAKAISLTDDLLTPAECA